MVTNITNKLVLLQKHLRVIVLVDNTPFVIQLRDRTITAKKESCNIVHVAIADQASSVNENDTKINDDNSSQLNWREETALSEQFNSYCELVLAMMNEFKEMCEGRLEHISAAKHAIELLDPGVKPFIVHGIVQGRNHEPSEKLK